MAGKVVYEGESGDQRGRLQTHARDWGVPAACSWVATQATEAYQRHEIENDLIGACFAEHGGSPVRQFGSGRR